MNSLSLLLDSEDGVETGCDACDEAFMARYCQQALETQRQVLLSPASVVEISVQLLSRESMRSLNLEYRQKDAPTNVLSFESGLPVLDLLPQDLLRQDLPTQNLPAQADQSGQSLLSLGDLVFCPDIIAQEARQQNKQLEDHWAHLLVHGTLHLCGFDHEELAQANSMELLEIQILSGSGIADPYQAQPFQ